MAEHGWTLTRLYAAIDTRNWRRALSLVSPSVSWHQAASDVLVENPCFGRDELGQMFERVLGPHRTAHSVRLTLTHGAMCVAFVDVRLEYAGYVCKGVATDVFWLDDGLVTKRVRVFAG